MVLALEPRRSSPSTRRWAGGTAAVPDQVPVARRGLIGGLIAIAGTVGVLLGIKIAELTGSIAQGYVVIAVVMLALSVPYVLGSRDIALPPRPRARADGLEVAAALLLDLADASTPTSPGPGSRGFLVNLGNWIALNYLFYFLTDGLGFGDDDATARLGVLVLIYGGTTVAHDGGRAATGATGSGRRKVFVIWSGILIGVSSAGARSLAGPGRGRSLAAFVLGAGFGVYQAVDFALITQVLPAAAERAKDLGVINIASALPQVLAPAVAGLILVAVAGVGRIRRDTSGDVVVASATAWSTPSVS